MKIKPLLAEFAGYLPVVVAGTLGTTYLVGEGIVAKPMYIMLLGWFTFSVAIDVGKVSRRKYLIWKLERELDRRKGAKPPL